MGQFSWLYSDTNKQVVDNKEADAYLLVPEPYQEEYGKYILETCYDGYGHFGNYDVYELVALWNRKNMPLNTSAVKEPELSDFDGLLDFEKEENR